MNVFEIGQPRHGLNKTKEHQAWTGMRKRCRNPKTKHYANYGGRGIDIDPSWELFECFLNDMGFAPSPKHSLDRIDNTKGYSKTNCRWATNDEQARNKRNNRFYTYKNQTLCLSDWARRLGMKREVVRDRLRRGWSIDRIVETPLMTQFTGKKKCPKSDSSLVEKVPVEQAKLNQ